MDFLAPEIFKGQVILVTGGGSGLGLAMAELFGRHGGRIAICGRRIEILQRAAEQLQALDIEVLPVVADIRQPDAVERLVKTVTERWGAIAVLVNNAGGQFPKPALDISPKGFDAVVRTNLYGTFYVTQAVARTMVDGGTEGAIVNILVSSLSRGIPGVAHTMAARAGVLGYMKTVAREWGPLGIRINAVGPGLIVTPGFLEEMQQTGDPEMISRTEAAIPLRRLGQPHDIAQVVAFLASPAAGYITGEYITVDGGNSLAEGISVTPQERISAKRGESSR